MAMFAIGLLALCLAAVHGQECRTKGKGRLYTFSNDRAYINLPCKYHLTTTECQGYKIHVAPGQAFDTKARYFTNTVWVAISKPGTDFYWNARSSTKLIKRFFVKQEIDKPYNVKGENVDNSTFKVEVSHDSTDYSVTFGVSDADFEITYFGYDAKSKNKRKTNGVLISCPEPTFSEKSFYPDSFCGNTTSKSAIRQSKRQSRAGSKSKAVIYDLLNNERIVQTNPQCDLAGTIFRKCQTDRGEAISQCADLVMNKKLIQCLHEYNTDPMDVFIHCLRYKCENSKDSCDMMDDAVQGCPTVKALKGGCPA